MSDEAATQAKQRQRTMWAAGHWDDLANLVAGVGDKLLDRVGIEPGMEVLDVGTGSGGNVAIPAARRGARVVGGDLTPELFAFARRRAAAAGVEVEWVEADAEALPFEDGRFDRVLSTFGHMFAPRHAMAAAELVRVCRPDGVVAFTTWPATSMPGRMFGLMDGYLPPRAPGLEGPVTWGDEDHVRALLEPLGRRVQVSYDTAPAEFDGVDAALAFYEENFGLLVLTRPVLEAQGRWEDLRAELRVLLAESDRAGGDGLRIEPEYLVAVGRAA